MSVKNILIVVLLVVFNGLVLVKIFVLDYTPSTILPETGYRVKLEMEATGHGSEINIRAMLPPNTQHQDIFDEQVVSDNFNYGQINAGLNRIGHWYNNAINGPQKITYTFNVISKKVNFMLPKKLSIPVSTDPNLNRYLEKTDLIQVRNKDILRQLSALGIDRNSDMIVAIRKIYKYISEDIKTTGFSGKTDAITTLRLQEASCNGKSRL
ncbi:MAG TPA: UUP1 family membrane protein, partial [Bacteroidales bacterium]|nr:UUP1 family membrane protein [Bacteroidales bacterium]